MYEYKVDIYKIKYAQDAMNAYAKEGWRVISVSPDDHHSGFLDVVFEREAPEIPEEEESKKEPPKKIVIESAANIWDDDRKDIWGFTGN